MQSIKRYSIILGVFIQDSLAYRSQITLWMLTDIVPAMIMPFVWFASQNGRPSIGGFTSNQLVLYYLSMTFLGNFVVSHVQWEMSRDIKDGTLSKFLLYPLSYQLYHFIGNLSYRVTRCFIFLPFVVLWILVFHRYMDLHSLGALHLGWSFWLALGLGHTVAFFFAWALGTLAFYFVEMENIFVAYYVFLAIFSGQLAPYALLPPALKTVATWTPFRYTLSFPLEVLNGRVAGDAYWTGVVGQAGWLVVLIVLGNIGWRRGSRRYAGAGM
jgi:ABC-2 type transport system permease protein